MKKTISLKLIILYSCVAILGLMSGIYLSQSSKEALGSVPFGNEYQSTTTRNHLGASIANYTVLSSGQGSLGSVVITGAGAGTINIYDATSTVTNSAWATTTLASFPASTAVGTYTFDTIYRKGLMIEVIGATATSTITYR